MQPGVDGRSELSRLRVVRIHVVLALNRMPGELEQAADGVAEDRAPAMADVQRPGGVDAGKLDLQPLAAAEVAAAVARRDARDELAEPVIGQTEVHVS